LFLTELKESESDLLATRLVTVLVAKLLDALTSWLEAELSIDATFTLAVLLEDSPNVEALLTEAASCCWLAREEDALVAKLLLTALEDAELAARLSLAAWLDDLLVAKLSLTPLAEDALAARLSLAAWLDDLLVAKLSVVPVFAARFLFEDRFALAFNALAPLEELVPVLEAFCVELPEIAPPAAVVLLFAVPTVPAVLPPLAAWLLEVELPLVPAVPFLPAAAKFAVEPEADVLFFALAEFDEAANVPEAAFAELALIALLVPKAFVVPLDLAEFSAAEFVKAADLFEFAAKAFVVPLDLAEFSAAELVKEADLLEFAAKASVVPLDFDELLAEEADSDAPNVLLAFTCCVLLLLAANVSELV
jgi:hypothetical protein